MKAQFCSECGTKADGNFCAECGRNLQQFEPNDQQNQAQYTNDQRYTKYVQAYTDMNVHLNIEEFKTIVGGNPAENNYYTDNYIKMRITQSTVSWNWAAFLLAMPWAISADFVQLVAQTQGIDDL